ncbi:hypothetical protein ESZ39_13365 [Colwellia sp. C1TZA3]|nr:hypothetical protein ESZ39_13365 [Colwellia sp. C1TZA3]
MHQYVTQLAKQLFLTSDMIRLNKRVAVGTFLPMMDINGKYMPASNALGQQIQESFVTLATQAGMSVIEFKATTAIKIQENQDIMLSRKVSEINSRIKADYYLTGTYSTLEQSITVNVRLIDVNTQKVIAAATDFIPTNVMWSQPKVSQPQVTMKDNRFYRGPF